MKNNKIIKKTLAYALLACCIGLSVHSVNVIDANAGMSYVTIEDSNKENGFSVGNWTNPGSGVNLANGGVEFFASNSADSRIISKSTAVDMYKYDKSATLVTVFESSYGFRLTSSEGKFGFMFGLSSAIGKCQAKNSSFVWASRNGNTVTLGISEFLESGTERVVVSKDVACGTSQTLNFSVTAYRDYANEALPKNKLTVKYGVGSTANTTLLSSETVINSAVGYLGFGQTGKSEAKLTSCKATTRSYLIVANNSSENTWAIADFESGDYNLAEWYSEANFGYFANSAVKVHDGKLTFKNVSHAVFSTKFEYSNFETEFKVTDLQRYAEKDGEEVTAEYDPDVKLNEQYDSLISTGFTLGLGALDYYGANANSSISFEPYYGEVDENGNAIDIMENVLGEYNKTPNLTRIVINNNGSKSYFQAADNFWAKDAGDIVIKLKVVDGAVELSYVINGKEVSIEMEEFSVTPYGYVKIYANGTGRMYVGYLEDYGLANKAKQVSLALDYMKIRNLDVGSAEVKVDVSHNSSNTARDDYAYVDTYDAKDLLKGE